MYQGDLETISEHQCAPLFFAHFAAVLPALDYGTEARSPASFELSLDSIIEVV